MAGLGPLSPSEVDMETDKSAPFGDVTVIPSGMTPSGETPIGEVTVTPSGVMYLSGGTKQTSGNTFISEERVEAILVGKEAAELTDASGKGNNNPKGGKGQHLLFAMGPPPQGPPIGTVASYPKDSSDVQTLRFELEK